MGVTTTRDGKIEWNADEFMLLATKETVTAMKKATIFTQGVAKQMVGGAGTGRLYRRRKKTSGLTRRQFHRASAPGSPPARDRGILANSISHTVKLKGLTVNGFVGSDIDKIRSKDPTSDVEYGLYLELGTDKIAARPWLRPSLIKARPTIDKIFRKATSLL